MKAQSDHAWAPVAGPRAGEVTGFCALADGRVLASVSGDTATGGAGAVCMLEGQVWRQTVELPRFVDVRGLVCRGAQVFAATASGVLRSDDAGASFRAFDAGLGNANVMTLAVAADGALYAGTYGGGVFRLAGDAWQALPGTPSFVTSIAATDAGVFVEAESQVLEAKNGKAWQLLEPRGQSGGAIAGDARGKRVAVVLDGSIALSPDRGRSWRTLAEPFGVRALTFAGDLLYAGGTQGLVRMTKKGEITRIGGELFADASVLVLFAHADGRLFVGTKDGRVAIVQGQEVTLSAFGFLPVTALTSVHADRDGALCVTSAAGVHLSRDRGSTWQRVGGAADVVTQAADGALWCVVGGSIRRLGIRGFDAVAMVPQVASPPDVQVDTTSVSALGVSPVGQLWLGVKQIGLSFYPDNPPGPRAASAAGANPSEPDCDTSSQSRRAGPTPLLHAAGRQSVSLYRSLDRGVTWLLDEGEAACFAFDRHGHVYRAGQGGLWRGGAGERWERVLDKACSAVAIDASGRVVVATSAGAGFVVDAAGTPAPIASTFSERGAWGSLQGDATGFVALTVDHAGAIWGVTGGHSAGAFRLADGGRKWQSFNLGLMIIAGVGARQPPLRPTGIAFLPDGTGFIATEAHGLFTLPPLDRQ